MSDYRICQRCGKPIQVGQTHLCQVQEAQSWRSCASCGTRYPIGTTHVCPTTVGNR